MRAFSCWRKRSPDFRRVVAFPGMPWKGNSLFALYNANHFAATYIRRDEFYGRSSLFFGLREGVAVWRYSPCSSYRI